MNRNSPIIIDRTTISTSPGASPSQIGFLNSLQEFKSIAR